MLDMIIKVTTKYLYIKYIKYKNNKKATIIVVVVTSNT